MSLRFAYWKTTSPAKLGTVCVFTGRNEFIEKYFEVIADLRRRGFAVATMDWRGQGGSGRALRSRRKGYVKDFSEFDGDLRQFMREVVLPDCPAPYYAIAHSMGGNILLRAAGMRDCWFERMVLVAPMIRLASTGLPVGMPTLCRLARWAAFFGFGRMTPGMSIDDSSGPATFEGNVLTSDPVRFKRNEAVLEAEPALRLGPPTFAWLNAACRSMAMIDNERYPASVTVPLLIFGAGGDSVVSTAAIEEFAARLKTGSQIIIPKARHEILQERDELRRQFWAAFDAYLGGQC
jgi:lysophospholipase